jgi:Flp pilus assembly protein TadD
MSDNDRWVWTNEDEPIPALFRPEPSTSKTDPGLHLDLIAQDTARTPAASASLGIAVALHLEGKTEAALKELSSAIDGGENLAELHAAMGHIQFELQRYDDAAKSYLKAAQADPKSRTASYNRGVCLERLERWPDAADAFQKALEMDAKRVEARLGLGICFLHTGASEKALDAFEQCLKAKADLEPAQFGKAVALHLSGKPDQAEALYRKLLARNPNSEELLGNLVAAGIARKDKAVIKEFSERLFKTLPNSPAALEGLATLAFAKGDFEMAGRHCAKLVELAPHSFESWYNLGVASQELGRLGEAAKA